MNATMNTKDQRRDQRNLIKMLKSNDYESVEIMIKQKIIDLNFLDSRHYCSPLMFEVGRKKFPSIEMIQYLLDHGASIDLRDRNGRSALHLLMLNKQARSSNAPCIELLLSHGANPNGTDNTGDTPLHTACICANTNAVKCLLAFRNDGQDQISKLQNKEMTDGILQTIDVNCINDAGDSPLMLATNHKKLGFELVGILLEYNAEVNLVNKQKCSALHFAGQYGSSQVVHLLLIRGADVNIVNNEDRTPLECLPW